MKIIQILHLRYHPRIIGYILKKQAKEQVCLYSWDYTIDHNENEDGMKNRLHRFDMNRPRPRYRHKYTKYKFFLSMMMFICIRQHLSNIWSSFHEKVKQLWDWIEKSVGYKKNCVLLHNFYARFPLCDKW